ncbi:MAG: restriction endonuclease S subunit [bacterium]|nr:MAG: restriction endonuclease S subunit [bacterium]KAF0147896.1 MAG: restriction endonuclease S subunit [bacterium]KAF0167497.1 MAG: restriction endonuclease S subunit [bacterium]TXT20967.1 MAG: restriction endonuclease S subunit [bacterium]
MGVPNIAISPSEWAIIKNILERHVPQYEVWAFGSRAKWISKEYSDLDLAIITDKPLSLATSAALTDDFSESPLPYKVDVVDWATTSESFRKIIERDRILVQKNNRGSGINFDVMVMPLEECLDALIDYRGKTPVKTESGIPLITAKVIKGGRIETPTEFIAKEDYDSWMRRGLPKAGDVVLTVEAPLGEVAQLGPAKIALAQRVVTLRGKAGVLNNTYLLYLLQTEEMQSQLKARATGTTVLGIKQSELRKVSLRLPPIDIQVNTAAILKALDDKIALLRETNITLEAIAQALFKSWFVDFDPVRAKAEGREPEGIPPEIADLFPSEFEDSPLGEIPKGWRVGGLGVISRNLRIGAKPEDLTDDTAYIGLEHMPRQSIALDSWEGASKVESGKSRFRRGQILFGKLRPYFHKVGIAPIDGVCSTDILVIEATSSAWHSLCLCLFSSKALVDHATQLSNGAKMPRTNWHDLANYQITIPPVNIAQTFDDIVSSLLDRIIANVHQAKELTEVRDAILPKLMSGALHMPVVEATS